MRLVLDTSVLVAAVRSRHGASRLLLNFAQKSRVQLVASSALFLEYEQVLQRPEHVGVHQLSPEEIDDLLIALAGFTEEIRIHFCYRPQLRDPNDEMVFEAAINGSAQAIVTHNVRDFCLLPRSSAYRSGHPGIS